MSDPEEMKSEITKGLSEAAKEAVSNLLGPPTKELGLFAGDLIANWRMKNLVSTFEKLKSKYESSELPKEAIERLPFGFRAFFVEKSSTQENEDLQAAWANLLKSALDGEAGVEPIQFAKILDELTPLSAKCLNSIASNAEKKSVFEVNADGGIEYNGAEGKSLANEKAADLVIACEKLVQLSLVSKRKNKLNLVIPRNRGLGRSDDFVSARGFEQIFDAIKRNFSNPEFSVQQSIMRQNTQDGEVVYFSLDMTAMGHEFLRAIDGTKNES